MGTWHLYPYSGIPRAVVGALIGVACGTAVWAQEITNFKFTGYEASVSTNVQSDATHTTTSNGIGTDVTTSDQRQTDVRLETSLMTHSYVYHPKFLSLDMGLGVIGSKNTLENNGLTVETREPLYNFSLLGSVLPEKSLHGTFFYDRVNTTPTINSTESFNQQNNRYGFTTALTEQMSPVAVLMDVTREENKGEGSQRSLDEKIDRLNINARKFIQKYGYTELAYRKVQQDTSNGVNGLPIQSSTQDSQSVNLDTRLKLGTKTLYDLNNHIEFSKQKYVLTQGTTPELTDARFGIDYRGYHAANLTSYGYFQSNRSSQDLLYNRSNALTGGANWTVSKDFDVSGGAHAGNTQATLISSRTMGVNASTRYERPLAVGKGTWDYSARYEKLDQTANAPVTTIIGQSLVIYKNQWVSLGNTNINIASLRVFDPTRTLTYLTPDDYLVEQIGNTTRIRISLTSTQLTTDSADVLVDYEYDNGGTYGSTQVDQSLGFTWTLSPQFNMFVRYADSKPTITSGNPSITLNQVQSLWYGLRSSIPLSVRYDLVFTGDLDHEDRRETISSYGRTSAEMYLRGELPLEFNNDYRVGMRRVHFVADIATQSSDQTSYELAFGWRTNNGLNLMASALFERDSDFFLERDRKTYSLRALWRYRRFSMSADLGRTQETQGLYARDRAVGRLTLRRDI